MKNSVGSSASIGKLIFALFILLFQTGKIFSQSSLPVPDHIVIAILENHAYTQIIGSSAAPNINALAGDPYSALFTQSFGIEHPSQPNYLDLYSGCNQGITNDNFPSNNPFTSSNLGRQLMDAGKTFITYSEDLPSVGYNGGSSGNYVRKHNPAANWMGTGTNQIPSTTNQPFSAFPASDFSLLPTVCFIVSNQVHDMHNGSDPSRITAGDSWIQTNLENYIQWAKTHNSLFILTTDEDNDAAGNHILTIFNGQMVKSGQYSETINHYTILRTIEDMYGLSYACNASGATPITDCWSATSDVHPSVKDNNIFSVYPNPSDGDFTIYIESSINYKFGSIEIYDEIGGKVFWENFDHSFSQKFNLKNISPGIYFVKVNGGNKMSTKRLIVQ